MIKTKKQMFTVVGVFALVMLLGTVSYAFFNYTKTGSANTFSTGRIAFNAEHSQSVTLSDLFPITLGENEEVTRSTPGVGSLSIHVTGDTEYSEGVEYLVKAVNVTGSNNVSLPISISIGYEASEGQGKTIGTEDEFYFTNRGGNTSRYKILSTDTISEGQDLVVGYIAPGETGIDGNIIIMAYLDARNIAITDTYDESDPETDTNGTTTDWVDGRTVLTTEEWNAFQSSGVSFQVKVEANEGTWVNGPPTIDGCPGCKFMYTTEYGYFGGATNPNATLVSTMPDGLVKEDYRQVISSSGKNHFLGFIEADGKISRSFACGIKQASPNQGAAFCVEFALNDANGGDAETRSAILAANKTYLNGTNLWQGGCTEGTFYSTDYVSCNDTESANTYADGNVYVGVNRNDCIVSNTGALYCIDH